MKIFKIIFIILFISFLVVYFSELTGYYEYKNHLKTSLTQEQINKYEEDIKSGKSIDIDNYILIDNYNYSNNLSKSLNNLSNLISKIVSSGVENSFRLISELIDN